MSTDDPVLSKNLITAAIEAAVEIRDPLDGLVEKTAIDPGAPFAPDALERLATLKKEDRAAFEALRAQLRKAGCRVTAPTRRSLPRKINALAMKWDTFPFAISRTFSE
jgi:hypothetical protein